MKLQKIEKLRWSYNENDAETLICSTLLHCTMIYFLIICITQFAQG